MNYEEIVESMNSDKAFVDSGEAILSICGKMIEIARADESAAAYIAASIAVSVPLAPSGAAEEYVSLAWLFLKKSSQMLVPRIVKNMIASVREGRQLKKCLQDRQLHMYLDMAGGQWEDAGFGRL